METLLRVYNDSSHYVGTKYFKKRLAVNKDKESIKNYESEFTRTFGKNRFKRGKEKEKDNLDKAMQEVYLLSLESGIEEKDRVSFMLDKLEERTYFGVADYVKVFLKNKEKLLKARLDRFRKKALNNKWNYFVTITYDDNLHDKRSFKEKLKKCLANLHSRYDYKYMGVFERSSKGRLHFHALMFIPNGEMRGKIIEKEDYSTSDKKMRVAHINTFFEKRFGRNDFIKINSVDLKNDNTINYLLKYIAKSEEKIFYSRGIPTFLYIKFENEDDFIISQFGKFIKKYVLFDDIDILDSDLQVKMIC